MNQFPNISPEKNYLYSDTNRAFTGQQILNLLELSNPEMQAAILLSIQETNEEATNPNDRYGLKF